MQLADPDLSLRYLLRPIERFVRRPGITDLAFATPGELHFETRRGWHRMFDQTLTLQWARSLVTAAATLEGKQADATHPFLAAALPHGLRLQAVLPPACGPDQILMCLRVAQVLPPGLNDFEFSAKEIGAAQETSRPRRYACLDVEEGFLKAVLAERLNVIVIGETGVGKTTLLRSLVHHMPERERIVTIEDVSELTPKHSNKAQLFYGDGAGVTASACARHALRLRPDRLILSECRGAEAYDFVQILLSGHKGTWTTLHAGSSEEALKRLVLMARMHPAASGLGFELLRDMVFRGVDLVIHVERRRAHSRALHLEFLHQL